MLNPLLFVAMATLQASSAPDLIVTTDNTRVTESCRIVIPDRTIIADADGNGVIHIETDGVTVTFSQGTTLHGANESMPWDQLTGTGIRITGENVTLGDLRVHGFKVGVHASGTHGLKIEAADLSDNFRQRLRSTPEREDSSDWLSPHANDSNEWLRYGAALYVEDARDVDIRDVTVRRGQNGILLDRVTDSRIYDNDCSFLSGWGIAMWRSSRNLVSRNALDFCIRGHVEGVYNRGQDSAGILMFEQCNENVIAENSATHGGDGFFGFGGRSALGEGDGNRQGSHERLGCNDNLLLGNDFSYAAAHGIELTFSFGNRFIGNRLVENAICGVWGGFSQDTLIADNQIVGNGGMGYGLERGGVNIEHGANNVIVANRFMNNRCAVHLWWDGLGGFADLPWYDDNYKGMKGNIVAGNTIVIDSDQPFGDDAALVGLHVRDDGGGDAVGKVVYAANTVNLEVERARETDVPDHVTIDETPLLPSYAMPRPTIIGTSHPVGARADLAGRRSIIMDEWGPWDHETPMLRPRVRSGGRHVFEVFGVDGSVTVTTTTHGVGVTVQDAEGPGRRRIEVSGEPGVHPYEVRVHADDLERVLTGTLISARWRGRVFSWTERNDPRTHFAGWRALAETADAHAFERDSLDLAYGSGGPGDMAMSKSITAAGPGRDHFGMIAETSLPLEPGTWRIRTVSDDGIRVLMNGSPVIDNWTWHGPTPNEGTFRVREAGVVTLEVLHFEIDGYAILSVELDRVGDAAGTN